MQNNLHTSFHFLFKKLEMELMFLKLSPCKCLSKLPTARYNVVASDSSAITCSHFEREALTIEVVIALPILPPVPGHSLPSSLWPFDGHRMYISSSTNICDQNQVEVWVSIDCESDSSFLHTGDSVLRQPKRKSVKLVSLKLRSYGLNFALFH